ncbi:HD domain-containing protein [Chryseobacterium sp. JV274]|uniref:HD domain-containing protein n=1 Tax=Chryseobacterium sp. JV274 TaxID=1932669 RepID=UPI000985BF4D|nr:HD domain-containing protein [Chryseobacterium sp. JV274]
MNYKDQLYNARKFAIEKHNGQHYGIYPYEIHLGNVVSVLMRFSILPTNQENTDILISAWLHDILEDTTVSIEELEKRFGKKITEIVYSLTDGDGKNREERKDNMYNKLIHNQISIIVKLADRIANVEFCLIQNNKKLYDMYQKEQPKLQQIVSSKMNTEIANSLLIYLKTLL